MNQHCVECRDCALKSMYNHQPEIPVQEYPEVTRPMARIHIDLTGELPVTDFREQVYTLGEGSLHQVYTREDEVASRILV